MVRWLSVLLMTLSGCSGFDSIFGIAVSDDEAEDDFACGEALQYWCQDCDGDGYGTKEGIHPSMESCENLTEASFADSQSNNDVSCANDGVERYVENCGDCDDANASVHPGADECDNDKDTADNDCDTGTEPVPEAETYYKDEDGDGYGAADKAVSGSACETQPDGTVENSEDCDDTPPTDVAPGGVDVNPGAEDHVCSDGLDQNCDESDDACALTGTVALSDLEGMGMALAVEGGGKSVASGDEDGDGVIDLVVVGQDGAVKVLGDGSTIESTEEGFGSSVAVGHWDNDSDLDIAVSSPAAVKVVLMDTTGTLLASLTGESSTKSAGDSLATIPGTDSDQLVIPVEYPSGPGGSWSVFIYTGHSDAELSSDTAKVFASTFVVADGWDLSLSASLDGSMLAIGDGTSGAKVFDPSDLTLYTALGTSDSNAYLGASVLIANIVSDDKMDLLVGAPGVSTVYCFEAVVNLTDSLGTIDADMTWTGTSDTGAGLALVNDLNGDGEQELVIGADGALYLLYGPDFSTGDLESIVSDAVVPSAKVTGFGGSVKQIVSAGDLDVDGYNDMVVTDGTDAYILYGGPP